MDFKRAGITWGKEMDFREVRRKQIILLINQFCRQTTTSEAMITAEDPVCGMIVDVSTSLSVECNGQKFFFCSGNCMQKFITSPFGKNTLNKLVNL